MKRVMKFSLLFDDDVVDDDDDICFYACVVCFYFVRYVRLKFYADFSSHKTAKNTHRKHVKNLFLFLLLLSCLHIPPKEREREMLESERVAQIVPEMQREKRERERVNMLFILTFFFSLFTFSSLQKKKDTNA